MDPRSLLLTTDYPIDQVIYRSDIIPVTISAQSFKDITIPNPLGKKFLPVGQYSPNANLMPSYDVFGGPLNPSTGVSYYHTDLLVHDSEMTLQNTNFTGSSITLYWRIVGLPIAGVDYSGAPSTNVHQLAQLNTDHNYMKLAQAGSKTMGMDDTHVIYHNLGYIPYVLMWFEDEWAGYGIRAQTTLEFVDSFSSGYPIMDLYEDRAVISTSFMPGRPHWRIYLDS